jgi:hypothetical protein
MRTKQIYESFKNSQKIRIMVNGFGMYMQIKDIPNICTTIHRVAVEATLVEMDMFNSLGLGKTITVYDSKMNPVSVDVQIDLVEE